MKKCYCVIIGSENAQVIEQNTELSFTIGEMEKWLKEDYLNAKIKCFPKKKQAMNYLTCNLRIKALFHNFI